MRTMSEKTIHQDYKDGVWIVNRDGCTKTTEDFEEMLDLVLTNADGYIHQQTWAFCLAAKPFWAAG